MAEAVFQASVALLITLTNTFFLPIKASLVLKHLPVLLFALAACVVSMKKT